MYVQRRDKHKERNRHTDIADTLHLHRFNNIVVPHPR